MQRCEGYRNFCNKLWNASRYVLMNCEGKDTGLAASRPWNPMKCRPLEYSDADRWIISRLQLAEIAVTQAYRDYRFDMAAREIYEFVWDEYCDWYLEFAKVQLNDGSAAAQRATRRTLARVLEATLRLAHPIIPFITEELWQNIAPLAGKQGESIMLAALSQSRSREDQRRCNRPDRRTQGNDQRLPNLARRNESVSGSKVPLLAAGDEQTLAEFVPYLMALAKLSVSKSCATACPTPMRRWQSWANFD